MANTSTEASAKPKEVVEEKKSTLTATSLSEKPIAPPKHTAVADENEDDDDLEEMRQITEKAAKESNNKGPTVKLANLSIFIPDLTELPEQDSEKDSSPKGEKSSKF